MTQPAVYLFRHGKTALNAGDQSPDRIRGWKDVPLDEEGKQDAKELAQFATTLDAKRLFSSNLQRARDVADAIAKATGLTVHASTAFRPWNLGDLQGESSAKAAPLLQKHAKQDPHQAIPGGESFIAFQRRFTGAMRPILDRFAQDKQTVIIVTHFRDIKLTQAWLENGTIDQDVELDEFSKDDAPIGSVLCIRRKGDRWTTELINPTKETTKPFPGIPRYKMDAQGGIVPQDLKKAKTVDLITLADGQKGTNCGNCEYFLAKKKFCQNEKVRQYVNDRMCCALWDAPGVLRAWEKEHADGRSRSA